MWRPDLLMKELFCGIGANIEAADNNKCTPLHFAAGGGHEAVVRVLLDAGELCVMACRIPYLQECSQQNTSS